MFILLPKYITNIPQIQFKRLEMNNHDSYIMNFEQNTVSIFTLYMANICDVYHVFGILK